MSDSGRPLRRRSVLGGAAAGVAGTLLGPGTAWAGTRRTGPTGRTGPLERSIDAEASRIDQELIALRRDLHAHPELAGEERRTAAVAADALRRAGLHVTTGVGGTGVVGVLTGARPGRAVAYRAELDAVPPQDQIAGPGVPAHLCGHDLHVAVAVGAARVLARLRHRLAGRVVFVLQPGEENLSGAAAMLADGVLERFRPAEIHALHCGPVPVGAFVATPGSGLPGRDQGVVTLPSPDAAVRLAADVNALGTVARPASPADLERLVTDILTPHGPLESFVFMQARAVGAEVQLWYRCWPERRWTEVRRGVHRLAALAGATSVAFPDQPFPAVITPRREGHELRSYLERTVGPERTLVEQAPIPYSGDDFALFLDRLPGTYSFLGVRRPGAGIETSYPHFGAFDPDERAIGHGVRAMAGWLAGRTAL